jgi:hypothetical protein
MTLILLRRGGIAFALFAMFAPIRAAAGPVYLALVIDPPTTAGSGVPTIPRQYGVGTFSVSSNKSGPGTFHLFALDATTGSFGISFFSVGLTGNVSNVLNRAPTAVGFDTLDDNGESTGQSGSAGFSEPLIRSGSGGNPPVPIQAGEVLGSPFRIGGMGQIANNFNNTPNLPVPPTGGTRTWSGLTSGVWGNYADAPAYNAGGKSWLLLGEGQYSGSAPTVDFNNSTVLVYTVPNFNSQNYATVLYNPGGPSVNSGVINNVNANVPGSLLYTFTAGNWADFWSDFQFVSYTPGLGGSGTGPAIPAAFDPATQKFSWNSVGSSVGTYTWSVKGTNINGSSQGTLTINVTAIPEPASISLFVFAFVALNSCIQRRR